MKSFLIIDDHEVVRAGVKNVLKELYKPCTIEEAGDEKAALSLLKQHSFDLVIMDVQMPGTDTAALMEYISHHYTGIKVLMFSMSGENIYAKRFLKAGAMGFVSKNSGLSELTKAIDLVLNNRRYISENLVDILANQIGTKASANPFETLSTRETDIAASLIKGISVTEISESLNISVSTVATYKSRLFDKLKIKNIAELIELGRLYNLS